MQDGAYFLDRDPKKFEIILNYLREDELVLLTKTELCNLKIEARYFQLTNLLTEINSRLNEMEVYKFRSGDACLEVKKSYFRKVQLSTIVKFMCRNLHIDRAFSNSAESVKDFFENEIIDVEIPPSRDVYRNLDLNEYISSVRHHLVLYDEYVRVNATHINVNFRGRIFPVKISVALKDKESYFYKCWYTIFCDEYCSGLFLDEEGIYSPLDASYHELEMITTSLQKLETSSIAHINGNDEDEVSQLTEFDNILYEMGFLGDERRLVDV